QFIIASHITVITTSDLDQEYEADKIPPNVPYCIFLVVAKRNQQSIKKTTYFDTECFYIKPGHTFLISEFIRYVTSESIAVEATDIDFIHWSDFDIIIDKIESQVPQTSQAPKKDLFSAGVETTQLPKCKKKII
ncbi:8265_t:CDS:2, partial [Gigaspora rosea]